MRLSSGVLPLGLILLAATGAIAAEDDDNVSVVKPPASLEHWSKPTAVVDRGQLQDAGADLPAVLDDQPGLRLTRMGGLGSFSLLSVRGSTADQVSVFLDGIPLSSAEGGPVDLASLPLGPIGSVALYRGLSPIMLGSSAIGGAVDVRTRQLHGHRLELEAGGGSFGTRQARGFYGYGEKRWGVGVSLDYRGSEGDFGYLDDGGTAWTTADDRDVTRNNNAHDHVAAMAKARVSLGDWGRLTLLDLATHVDRGLPGLGLHQTARSRLAQTRNVVGARLETVGRPLQLALTPYFVWSQTAFDDPLGEVGLGLDHSRDQSLVPGVSAALRGEVELDGAGGWRLVPLVAAAWRLDRFVPDRASGPTASLGTSERNVVSVATELDVGSKAIDTELVGTLRYEAAMQDGADSVDGISWRVALVHRSIPDTRLQLSASRSLRFPSLFELFGDTGYVLGNAALRPEAALSLEASIAHDAGWLGDIGWWRIEVAGFVTWVDDLIQLVQNAQNVSRPENVDAARIAGVEVGTRLDLLEHLHVRGSFTWLDAVNRSDIAARSGKRLPFRPEFQAYLRVEGYHDFGLREVGRVGVRVELEHLSGNHLDHANLVTLPTRWLLGLGVHATFLDDQLDLDVSVRNVADSRVQDLAGFPLPGVSAMASLRWTPNLASSEPVESEPATDQKDG